MQSRKVKRPREAKPESTAFGSHLVPGFSLGQATQSGLDGSSQQVGRPRESGRKAKKSRKSKKSKKRKPSKRSTSSYSSSSSTSDSGSESVVREAKRRRTASRTYAELLECHRTKPGRFRSEMSQEMENKVGLGGERMTWSRHDRPASAQSYYL